MILKKQSISDLRYALLEASVDSKTKISTRLPERIEDEDISWLEDNGITTKLIDTNYGFAYELSWFGDVPECLISAS